MYREGNNGFNIPYGLKDRKTIPSIFSETDINKISKLIKDVNFNTMSFKDSIKNIKKGDFVYLDPPYAPENEDISLIKNNNQKKEYYLTDIIKILIDHDKKVTTFKFSNELEVRGVNSKVDLVTYSFKDFTCEDAVARRAINSKKPGSKTIEVIIYN